MGSCDDALPAPAPGRYRAAPAVMRVSRAAAAVWLSVARLAARARGSQAQPQGANRVSRFSLFPSFGNKGAAPFLEPHEYGDFAWSRPINIRSKSALTASIA